MNSLYLCRKCSYVNTKGELNNLSKDNHTKTCNRCKGRIFYKVTSKEEE